MKKQSLPKLKSKALELFSYIVKLRAQRDGKLFCYTCDAPLSLYTSNCQAGHYLSRGLYSVHTFNFDNCRPQDYRCNVHLHGNTIEFRERLIKEIGLGVVELMEAYRHKELRLTRTDYLEMIEKFKEEITLLENK